MQQQNILQRLLGLRRSCVFQMFFALFLAGAIPFAILWYSDRPVEFNPYHLGGEKCEYSITDTIAEQSNGLDYTVYQVKDGQRMTDGELVALEKGKEQSAFMSASLPPGNYTIALRFKASFLWRATRPFVVLIRQGTSYSRSYRQTVRTGYSWHSTRSFFSLEEGGTYELEVRASRGIDWCFEIARDPHNE